MDQSGLWIIEIREAWHQDERGIRTDLPPLSREYLLTAEFALLPPLIRVGDYFRDVLAMDEAGDVWEVPGAVLRSADPVAGLTAVAAGPVEPRRQTKT